MPELQHEQPGRDALAIPDATPVPADVPVLIVGGGPVGLTTALLLARQGVQTLLVERHPGTSIHPRARGINVRTMEIFRSLSLEPAIRQAGEPLAGSRYMLWVETLAGAELRRVTTVDLHRQRDRIDDVSPTDWVACAQDDLEPILLAEARRYGVDVRFGVICERAEQDADGVTATLVTRESGHQTTVRAGYLVAADGGRSGIRGARGIGMAGPGSLRRNVSIYFRADLVAQTHDRQFILCFVEHPAVRGLITSVNQTDRWILNVPEDASLGTTATDLTPERCVEVIRTATGLPDLAVEILSVLPWEARAEVAERFQDGRIFLAGDAAHLMPPAGAFGMNTGIQDAHNLAWKLAAVVNGTAGPGLLASYEQERHPAAALTVQNAVQAGAERFTHQRAGQNLSRRAGTATSTSGWAGTATAERAEVAAPPAPPVDDLAVMLGYWYASSAVLDGPAEAPTLPSLARSGCALNGRPGTRAPHLWLQEGDGDGRRSTLDLFDGRLGLLAGPGGGAWLDALRMATLDRLLDVSGWELGMDVEAVEGTEAALAAFGIEPDGAVLVRPDGFVGWRSAPGQRPSPEVVGAVLDRLLGRA